MPLSVNRFLYQYLWCWKLAWFGQDFLKISRQFCSSVHFSSTSRVDFRFGQCLGIDWTLLNSPDMVPFRGPFCVFPDKYFLSLSWLFCKVGKFLMQLSKSFNPKSVRLTASSDRECSSFSLSRTHFVSKDGANAIFAYLAWASSHITNDLGKCYNSLVPSITLWCLINGRGSK